MRNLIIGSDKNIKKKTYFWTMVSSLVNASESVIILMLATRFTDLESAGVLSISFAVANLMLWIGKFGMRNYQATDVGHEYEFGDYLGSRYFSMLLMFAAITGYLMYGYYHNGYSSEKVFVVLMVCLMYSAEAFEDVYWASYQNKQRMDVGAKMFALRWTAAILSMSAVLVVTKKVAAASFWGMAVNWIVLGIMIVATQELRREDVLCFRRKKVWELLKKCSPLCLSTMLSYYITNASKYAIDACLNDEVQACYSFVAMPNFVIHVVSGIIYQPMLVSLTQDWKQGDLVRFKSRIRRQCAVLLGLSAVCLFGTWLLGIPLLSWLYHTELSGYKAELLLLMLGGMFVAYTGFFLAVLTTMRKVKEVTIAYVPVAAVACAASNPIVRSFGTVGAAASNVVWTFLTAWILGCLIVYGIKKETKNMQTG